MLSHSYKRLQLESVADPGFPRGGGANLLFDQKFPKNCMKMKEFGPGGGAPPLRSTKENEEVMVKYS